jgi:hypothetical protein
MCLNRHRQGLTPWSSEYQIRPMPFLPIQYSPFFPNCPVWSHFKPLYHLFKFSTFLSWTRVSKSLNLTSGVCHSTSIRVLSTKHSITNGFFTTIVARWYTKGIMHSRISFLPFWLCFCKGAITWKRHWRKISGPWWLQGASMTRKWRCYWLFHRCNCARSERGTISHLLLKLPFRCFI